MKKIETKKAPQAIGPYSQAIEINNIIYTSGQIAIQPEIGTIVSNDIKGQTIQVCENLKEILKASGSHLDNVIKTTVFIKNMSDFQVVNEIYGTYFKNKPARSCVEVSNLPKNALIEIEAIAYKDNI